MKIENCDSGNLFAVGLSGDTVMVNALDLALTRAEAINLTGWLLAVLGPETDQLKRLVREIMGDAVSLSSVSPSSPCSPAPALGVAAVPPARAPNIGAPAPASVTMIELRRLRLRTWAELLHQRPGAAERPYQEGYLAGLEKALGLLYLEGHTEANEGSKNG